MKDVAKQSNITHVSDGEAGERGSVRRGDWVRRDGMRQRKVRGREIDRQERKVETGRVEEELDRATG